ncbi:MAG: hypothetical protein CME59_04845 [Halioglobus sp.]|nr:hypothetical protein [Halioglobus sp.]
MARSFQHNDALAEEVFAVTRTTLPLVACLALLALATLPLGGCTCGFDCSSDDDDDNSPALLSLGVSDALPEDLSEVFIQVESITLRGTQGDVTVDTFSVDELDAVDEPYIRVDLLDYPGLQQLIVFSDQAVEPGRYSELFLEISASDFNDSTVLERDSGATKRLRVDGDGLTLPGMTLAGGEDATYTVEFELARALSYVEDDDSYLLSEEGIRVVNNSDSASLVGTVDEALFDASPDCDGKSEPTEGNRVYLYQGHDLDAQDLADVFNDDSSTSVPEGALAPFAVDTVRENAGRGTWEYYFGFLPAGDYTLAFTCDSAGDEAQDYDGLDIPLPTGQRYQVSLSAGTQTDCDLVSDLDSEDDSC